MTLNFHFPVAFLIGLLNLALQLNATFGSEQAIPEKTSEKASVKLLVDHPRINELLVQGSDRLLPRETRLKALREAVKIAGIADDPRLELRTLILSLDQYLPISRLGGVNVMLERAFELNQEVGTPKSTAELQVLQDWFLIRLHSYKEAIELSEASQSSNLLSKRYLARSYNQLTSTWGAMGMVRSAFDSSRKEIVRYRDDSQAEQFKIAQSNFAWMFVRTRRFDKAEEIYDEIAFKPEDKLYVRSLVGRCEIALHRNDFKQAMQLAELGIESIDFSSLLSRTRKKQLKGTLKIIQARCFYANGEFKKAKSLCVQALKLIPTKNHSFSEATAQLGLIIAENESPKRGIKIARIAFKRAMALHRCRPIDKVHARLFSSEALTTLYFENEFFKEAYAQLKKTKEIRDSLTVEDLALQLKLSEMRRQTEFDEQRLELLKTEEQSKTAQAVLVAANAIAVTEKSKVIRNVIGAVIFLTMLGGAGYFFSENRRHQVQNQLKETKEKAEHQEQFAHRKHAEDIGQLTGRVAHDFNNILQVISQTESLLGGSLENQLTDQQKEILEKKSTAVSDAEKITRQLLTYARRQSITPKVELVSTILKSTEALFNSIGDLMQVNVLNFDKTLAINVDQPQFSSAILNLLLNARDAMEGKGLVDVKVSEHLINDSTSLALEAGQYVRVEVSDTGKGMTEEQLKRASEPFFTTKPQTAGKGLGLSSVKGFVEQAGGAISIKSKLDEGTVVSLYFPKIETAETNYPPASSENYAVNRNARVCLIVESDTDARASQALTLESFGFDCTSCSSAHEAKMLLESRHDFSLVLSDVQLVGVYSGVELAEWIRERFPKLRVVLISENTAPPNLADFIFLRKPIRYADLQAELQLESV